jgi:hypothetical protein
MNVNTALIMFAVIAAFGLVTATLVLPIVPQVQGAPPPDVVFKACQKSKGHAFGGCI